MKTKLTTELDAPTVLTGSQYIKSKIERDNKQEKKRLQSTKIMFNEPVNFALATACVKLYEEADIHTLPRTNSIIFKRHELVKWINEIEAEDYDNLRICMGIYTAEVLKDHPELAHLVNRVTVFLFPFKGDLHAGRVNTNGTSKDEKYVDPFNMGELHP